MKATHFEIDIKASRQKVFDTMLGKESYSEWTSVFNPSSYYEGSFEEGAEIHFIGLSEEGKKEGMVGIVRSLRSPNFVSMEYIGVFYGDKVVTEGAGMEDFIGSTETYRFEGVDESATRVLVDLDVPDEYEDYFNKAWPKALEKLKEMCERL